MLNSVLKGSRDNVNISLVYISLFDMLLSVMFAVLIGVKAEVNTTFHPLTSHQFPTTPLAFSSHPPTETPNLLPPPRLIPLLPPPSTPSTPTDNIPLLPPPSRLTEQPDDIIFINPYINPYTYTPGVGFIFVQGAGYTPQCPVYPSVDVALGVVYCCLTVLGTVGNVTVLYRVWKSKQPAASKVTIFKTL